MSDVSELDVEQRLRAHFADGAARESLGEPDPGPVMAAARSAWPWSAAWPPPACWPWSRWW
jgi:hypothetical protein